MLGRWSLLKTNAVFELIIVFYVWVCWWWSYHFHPTHLSKTGWCYLRGIPNLSTYVCGEVLYYEAKYFAFVEYVILKTRWRHFRKNRKQERQYEGWIGNIFSLIPKTAIKTNSKNHLKNRWGRGSIVLRYKVHCIGWICHPENYMKTFQKD